MVVHWQHTFGGMATGAIGQVAIPEVLHGVSGIQRHMDHVGRTWQATKLYEALSTKFVSSPRVCLFASVQVLAVLRHLMLLCILHLDVIGAV